MEVTDFEFGWDLLPVVKFPHPILSEKTKAVTEYGPDLRELVHRMLATMYHEPGCGLSANQVGVGRSVFVTDTDYRSDVGDDGERRFSGLKPRVFINPRFKSKSGSQLCEEGCLSFPGISVEVERAKDVVVEFEGLNGETLELAAEDFFADCLQHESDHLAGVTFLDYLSPMKRQLAMKKYLKKKRERR